MKKRTTLVTLAGVAVILIAIMTTNVFASTSQSFGTAIKRAPESTVFAFNPQLFGTSENEATMELSNECAEGVNCINFNYNPSFYGIYLPAFFMLWVDTPDGVMYYNFILKEWYKKPQISFWFNVPMHEIIKLDMWITGPATFKFFLTSDSWPGLLLKASLIHLWVSGAINLDAAHTAPLVLFRNYYYDDLYVANFENGDGGTEIKTWEFDDCAIKKIERLSESNGKGSFRFTIDFSGIDCLGPYIIKGMSAPGKGWVLYPVNQTAQFTIVNWCGKLDFSIGMSCVNPNSWKDVSCSQFWNGIEGSDGHISIDMSQYLDSPNCDVITTTTVPQTTTTTIVVPPTTTTTCPPTTTTTIVVPPTTTTTTIMPPSCPLVIILTIADNGITRTRMATLIDGYGWHGQSAPDDTWIDRPVINDTVTYDCPRGRDRKNNVNMIEFSLYEQASNPRYYPAPCPDSPWYYEQYPGNPSSYHYADSCGEIGSL